MKSRYVTSRLRVDGGVAVASSQVKPTSIWQSLEHPSPSLVFPSSHASGASLMWSPQFDAQAPVAHSGSRVQLAEQPSPSTALPSSHASAPSSFPSPHTVLWQREGVREVPEDGGGSQ